MACKRAQITSGECALLTCLIHRYPKDKAGGWTELSSLRCLYHSIDNEKSRVQGKWSFCILISLWDNKWDEIICSLFSIINFLCFRHWVTWLGRTTAIEHSNKMKEKGRKIFQEADFCRESPQRHAGKQINFSSGTTQLPPGPGTWLHSGEIVVCHRLASHAHDCPLTSVILHTFLPLLLIFSIHGGHQI